MLKEFWIRGTGIYRKDNIMYRIDRTSWGTDEYCALESFVPKVEKEWNIPSNSMYVDVVIVQRDAQSRLEGNQFHLS
jgi:hypothetical protein